MNAVTPARAAHEWIERRSEDRFPVALPAAIGLAGQQYSARLINLAHSGALIETSAPLHLDTMVALHCGTIIVHAVVAWTKGNHIGLKFKSPLTDAQVIEQVSRTFALEFRRARTLRS